MRRPHVLLLFLVLLPGTLLAKDVPSRKHAYGPGGVYNYQLSLYNFLTGRYTSPPLPTGLSIEAPDPPDADIFYPLARLPELQRVYFARRYQNFVTGDGAGDRVPHLVWLMDGLYRDGGHEYLLTVADGNADEADAAAYFRGMSLLRLNRTKEAVRELALVPEQSGLYPYARVAMAQIHVMRKNFDAAEDELRRIASPRYEDLSDRISILLGKVLFEKGDFSTSLLEFMKVPHSSPYYKDALMGMAWSLVKLGSFESAIPLIKEMNPVPPYSSEEWEGLVMLGYCYLKLGRFEEASVHFNDLLDAVAAEKDGLERIMADESTPGRYLDFLLGTEPPPGSSPLTEEERFYYSMLVEDTVSRRLADEYAVLRDTISALRARIRDIEQIRTYLMNMIKDMEDLFFEVDMETRFIKRILQKISRKAEYGVRGAAGILEENRLFFANVEKELYRHWAMIKKRKISDAEKEVVRLLLYEGGEALDCTTSPLICTIVDMAESETSSLSGEDLTKLKKVIKVLEAIAKDLASVRNGEMIEYEREIEELRAYTRAMVEDAWDVIGQLEALRKRIKVAVIKADNDARTRMEAILAGLVKQRLEEVNYELSNFRAYIMTGLVNSQRALE